MRELSDEELRALLAGVDLSTFSDADLASILDGTASEETLRAVRAARARKAVH